MSDRPAEPKTSSASAPNSSPPPLETLVAGRREALKRLRSQGIDPYPYHFARTHSIAQLLHDFQGSLPEHGSEQTVSTAGRVMTVRDMGKSCFAHLADGPDRLQV